MDRIKDIEECLDKYGLHQVQSFDCRNWIGDAMTNIYDDGEVQIDYCYDYEYFEIFGLSDDGWKQLVADGYIRDWR